MASQPPSKDSKRHSVRDSVRSGLDRLKHAFKPSAHSPPQHSWSLAALPVGAQSPSPVPSAASSQVMSTQPVRHEVPDATGQSLGSLGASSSSAVANTVSATSPKPTTLDKVKEAGNTAWNGLEAALRVLETSADVFPPLKSAVGGFEAAANRKDYEELASEIKAMVDTLNKYKSELELEESNGSIVYIAQSINEQVAHIDKQRERGKTKRILESAEDREDVIKCYRRIESLFRQLQSDVSLRTLRNTNKQLVITLLQSMSPAEDARYDSGYSTTIQRHGCTPETREKVLDGLRNWVHDPNAAKVYWMDGMAGTGKTTLAYSLCTWLEDNKQLGASFFCSRNSPSCRDLNRIIPTIAYRLARYSPAFLSALCKVLEDDPEISSRNVVRQFEMLIQKPLMEVKSAIPEGLIVVVDALDECESNHGVRLILEVLLRFAADLPVKFFVTSRPEPAIRDTMLSSNGFSPSVLHLHDIEQSVVEEDIKKYLTEAFSSMSPPPSSDQIEQLAKRAGKLFIYAATAVRYIFPENVYVDSGARLRTMLAVNSRSSSKDGHRKKYKELDALYATILDASLNEELLEEEELEVMKLVLWTAVCAKEPMTSQALASLLGLTEQQVSSTLPPLRSVLHISEDLGLVSTLHASFPDYMFDRLRADKFHCDEAKHNLWLADRCFDVMKEHLRFNICNLESSFVLDQNVPDLDQRVKNAISPFLFYACRYWGDHIHIGGTSDTTQNKLVGFLSDRLLFWMEVLNLKQCIGMGARILFYAQNWLSVSRVNGFDSQNTKVKQANNTPIDTQKQAADARNFVTRFAASACSHSTPHIYISALPFCPKSSAVYSHYWRRTKGLMDVDGTAITRRERTALATWGTDSAGVNSIAYSPDGARIVFGCSNSTISVCDAHTGNLIAGPFEGHTDSVNSVAFSSDGNRIVSGSSDATIRVWDSRTGNILAGPLEGHTAPVNSVAFSPDGTRIVSGSCDLTIRVWDSQTGIVVAGPYAGHTGWVNSVAFSPDGSRIASGSDDDTVRVWDLHTSNNAAPRSLEGHTGSVYSIAFSPDGTRIASGSTDHTVRVWNAHTGSLIAETPNMHFGWIRTVAFSPEGARVISACDGGVIRMWDARTGAFFAGPFNGHTSMILSVAFSPDGTCIASGSADSTIRLWDAHIGVIPEYSEDYTDLAVSLAFSPDGARIVICSDEDQLCVRDAYTGQLVSRPYRAPVDSVNSVAFSPDGTHIVSTGFDNTIGVSEAHTGNTTAGPFEGHTESVNLAVFSPDATRIVSGSSDGTIRVWDAHTGDGVAGPFEGHTDSVNSVTFSPDGTQILSGSSDHTIRLWDARTGDVVAGPLEGHTDAVNSVAFSPDGARIVSGSDDCTIRVWDACTGVAVTRPFEGLTDSVQLVLFSPDGTRIISSTYDHVIWVWDSHTGDIIAKPFEARTEPVRSVALSPNGVHVVSSSGDYLAETYSIIRISSLREQSGLESALTGPWSFNDDGWVTSDNALLFWTSRDLHEALPYPCNTVAIGSQGSTRIEYRNVMLGKKWSECYIYN